MVSGVGARPPLRLHKRNGRQNECCNRTLCGNSGFAKSKKGLLARYSLFSCLTCDRYFVVAFNAELKAPRRSWGSLLSDQLIYFFARGLVL